jgi:hypothetical protein
MAKERPPDVTDGTFGWRHSAEKEGTFRGRNTSHYASVL